MENNRCSSTTAAGNPCKVKAMDNGQCRHHGGLVTNETNQALNELLVNKEPEAAPAIGDVINRQALSDMGHGELVLFARLNYGYTDISTKTTPKEDLIELIMNAARKFKGNAEMKVVDMGQEVEVPPGYIKIRVQGGKYNPNNRPIPVGLNFVMATIPVNKDVIMDEKWLVCLKDAVRTEYFTDRSDPTDITLGWNESHSYPYSILERG